MNVLVIGDKGVGKTSLIKRYTQNTFDDQISHDDNYVFNTEQLSDGSMIDIQIYDNCAEYETQILTADAILFCYDKNNENTFKYCLDLKEQIIQYKTKANVIILLIACKVDKGYSNREMEETKLQDTVNNFKWKNKINIFSLECSAKTGINVKSSFLLAAERHIHNVDLTQENAIFDQLIDIALDNDKTLEWTKCNSKDKEIRIEYGITGKDNNAIYTVRSSIKPPVNVSCDEFYDFLDAQKGNLLHAKRTLDSTNIDIRSVKIFDNDRCLVYSAYNSSMPLMISPRDFCYLQTRKRFEDYKNKNKYIVALVGYSVDDKFDGYIPEKKGRVRGVLYIMGYVFEKLNESQSRAYYVLKLDPCGSIPEWIVNQNATKKGYDIKWIQDHLLKLIKERDPQHKHSLRNQSHNTAISSFAALPNPTSTIIESPDKNQIFVDIVEYINVTSHSFYDGMNTNKASIVGTIAVKAFLSNTNDDDKGKKTKNVKKNRKKNRKKNNKNKDYDNAMEYLQLLAPGIRLRFNDDLIIGGQNGQNAPSDNKINGSLILDEVSFHKKILSSNKEIDDIIQEKQKMLNINRQKNAHKHHQLSLIQHFAKRKTLKFFLPNGEEFDIMNYKIISSFRDASNSPRDDDHKSNKLSFNQHSHKTPSISTSNTDYINNIRIPFGILPYFNVIQDEYQTIPTIEFYLKIKANFPRQYIGRDIIIEYNVPNCVSTVTLQTNIGNGIETQIIKEGNNKKKASSICHDLENNINHNKNKDSILNDAECITINKIAYNNDDNECINGANIGIRKKRQLNTERCTRKVVWRLNKFPSGVEQVLRCKFTLNNHHELTERLLRNENDINDIKEDDECDDSNKEFDLYQFRKIVSPIAMKFEIDDYNVSGLDIKSIRCIDWTSKRDDGESNEMYSPYRCVGRITKSGSYICRL